jgi:cell division protein FtsW
MKAKKVDRFFLILVFILLAIGVAMFISASLGILTKSAATFRSVLFNQLVLGLGLGLVGMYITTKIDYKFWRKASIFIFIASLLVTAAVFIPSLGRSHGGAQRWLDLGPFSMQPVEFLKFGFIIFFAAWLSWAKNKDSNFKWCVLPLIGMLAIIGGVLLKQPDTKSFILISITGFSMLFLSGVRIRYVLYLFLGAVIVFGTLVYFTPYLQERVKTFIDPASDPHGAAYQVQQSAIALGSGGIIGRGFGQSIQKFSYLPEPQGDSIFAVLGEEFGFIGVCVVIFLYALFALKGLRISTKAPDTFSGLVVAGIVILITVQSFMHIASITGVFPLTGVPLVFMSHGGTSLMIYLIATGIVLNISKFQKR